VRPAIESNAGLIAKEASIHSAFEGWWKSHGVRIAELSGQMDNAATLVALRNDLLESFRQSLEEIGLLDPFHVRGIVAGFWDQTKYDFLTLMARGAKGVADAWRTSIITALEDKANTDSPLEHKLVKFLMSDFVEALGELEARKAELETQIKAAAPARRKDEEQVEDSDEAAPEDADEDDVADEAQLKAWRKELAAVKKELNANRDSFKQQINSAVDGLTDEAAAELLLTILHDDMCAIVERYVAAQRKKIVAAFENWWDKYRVTLTEIEGKRDAAAEALHDFLKGLAYV
jgi:type I restriction enzyme M protein